MKKIILFAALALMAFPLFAADRAVDVVGFATWVDPHGNDTITTPNDNIDFNFDSTTGWGAAVNVFWSDNISTEFAGSVVDQDVVINRARPVGTGTANGTLKMIPITAVLQWHFNSSGPLDFYLGGGVAYVLFDNVDSTSDLNNVDLNEINFKDDYGFVANAGATWRMGAFLIYADGKYVPVSTDVTAAVVTEGDRSGSVSVNPLILSAGVGFSF